MILTEGARLRIRLAAFLSFVVLGIIFWGLFQIDLPFARFLRSLHISWLEQMGDLGTRLGSGAALVAVSGGLLLSGWLWKQATVQIAGFKSLLAHGLAAIAVQALKHGIGRPRPRLMHADNGLPWRPSLESGMDSFPSGHTTASFAVAAVLAKSFPKIAWLVYGLAGCVAVSRAVRGSHFPTDVIAGICLGTMVGIGVAYPTREWKRSLLQTAAQFLPYLIVLFSLLWLATHLPPPSMAHSMMVGGLVVITVGVAMRVFRGICRSAGKNAMVMAVLSQADALIVIGVALTTGLWLITAVAGGLSAIRWLLRPDGVSYVFISEESRCRAVVAEMSVVVGLVFVVFIIQQFKGLLPIV
ncbi:MAG TPA: phosphatase PAP2 family protein [Nitrospiraceae bacterium]|jgi:undecaprenyl-diphosphatase|nr:phosphatase PAP2 family protein [Nitrospiraceae bacterium]